MSEDALHRDDPTGVLLARAINHSHAAAPDFLQNFVMTEAPLVCRSRSLLTRMLSNASRDASPLASSPSRRKQLIQVPVIKLGYRTALVGTSSDSSIPSATKSEARLLCSSCCGGQCRAQMTDLVIHIGRVLDGVSNFLAQEPPITLAQIM